MYILILTYVFIFVLSIGMVKNLIISNFLYNNLHMYDQRFFYGIML